MTDKSLEMLSRQLLELSDCIVQGIFLLLQALHLASHYSSDPLGLSLHIELASSPEWHPGHFHLLIRLVVLVPDDVFKTGVVGGIFELEDIDVEDVVPKEMFLDVLLEVLMLLLNCLSGDVADVAEVFFVRLPGFLLFS